MSFFYLKFKWLCPLIGHWFSPYAETNDAHGNVKARVCYRCGLIEPEVYQ